MPTSTPAPTSTTKKITRLALPIWVSQVWPSQSTAAIPPRVSTTPITSRRRNCRRCSSESAIIKPNPTGTAAVPDRIRPAQCRRLDEGLVLHVIQRRTHQDQQQEQRREARQGAGPIAPGWRQPGCDGGQAHVRAVVERQHGAEHGEPEEHGGCQLVAPDERPIQTEAEDHPHQEDDHFRQDGDGRSRPHRMRDAPFEAAKQRVLGAGVGREPRAGHGVAGGHVN